MTVDGRLGRAFSRGSAHGAELKLLGAVLLAALGLRAFVLFAIEPTPLAGDELDYYQRAVRTVLEGRLGHSGERAPGNELFLATLFELFWASPQVARAGNVAISALTVIPIYVLGRQLGGSRTGLAAAALAAVYPNFIAYSHYLWAEPLYMLLTTSGLALLASVRARSPGWVPAVVGLLLGAAALTREVGLAFPPLAVAWLAFSLRASPRKAIASAGLLSAAFAVTILPWTLRLNHGEDDFALISRTTYQNLYIGNAPRVAGRGPLLEPRKSYWRLGSTREEAERGARELAFDAIAQRLPWWPAEKLVEELPRFFTPTSFAVRRLLMPKAAPQGNWSYQFRFSSIDTRAFRRVLAVIVAASYVAMAIAGVGGLVLAKKRGQVGLLTVFVAAQILPTIITFATSRFRLASMAALAVGAAVWLGAERPWADASPGRRRLAVVAMAATAVLILVRYEDALHPGWG